MKKRIALIAQDRVGNKMAGPGIRYFEMAKTLASDFDVSLFVPGESDIKSSEFKIIGYNHSQLFTIETEKIRNFDYVISQYLPPSMIKKIKKLGIRYIADLYDPITIEVLEYAKFEPAKHQKRIFDFNLQTLKLQLLSADHILCASPKQLDFYAGMLSILGKIGPKEYSTSPNIEKIVSIVPFGIEETEPETNNIKVMEEQFPEIKDNDKIVYWGGGIWNWFDPLSVIYAIENISKRRSDIKLFFLGVKHPNPKIRALETANEAFEYCQKKNLLNKFVFFNFDWTPYDQRVNYLKRATIGISTHNENLETRFSFRTRVLDYIWAELPMVLTTGDSMSALSEKEGLGEIVPYNDALAIEKAIIELIDDKRKYTEAKENIRSIKEKFYWINCLTPVIELIKNDQIEFNRKNKIGISDTYNFYSSGMKKKMFK